MAAPAKGNERRVRCIVLAKRKKVSQEGVPKIWESPAGKEEVADSPSFLSSVTECYVEELLVTDHLGLERLIDQPLKSQPLRYP
jgi:hypothetical protein